MKGCDADEQTGINIVRRLWKPPSARSRRTRAWKVRRRGQSPRERDPNYGLIAETVEYGDLLKQGV